MDPSDADALSDDEFEQALDRHRLRAEPTDEGSWGWSPGRIIAAAVLLVMVGFWMWAFSPWVPRGHPDELDDAAFAEVAEARCAAALDAIATIPIALEAESMDERAEQIEQSTAMLATMVDDLAAVAPDADTRDGDLVSRWLADWEVYLGDRYAYAADFRSGVDAAFEVTAVQGGQVTDPIDQFATINRMPSCASPTDV